MQDGKSNLWCILHLEENLGRKNNNKDFRKFNKIYEF